MHDSTNQRMSQFLNCILNPPNGFDWCSFKLFHFCNVPLQLLTLLPPLVRVKVRFDLFKSLRHLPELSWVRILGKISISFRLVCILIHPSVLSSNPNKFNPPQPPLIKFRVFQVGNVSTMASKASKILNMLEHYSPNNWSTKWRHVEALRCLQNIPLQTLYLAKSIPIRIVLWILRHRRITTF